MDSKKTIEKRKLFDLGRFVDFLKRFEENLSCYQRIVIEANLMDKKTKVIISGKSVGFSGDEIKDSYYDICDILVKFVDYDIISSNEDDKCISFDFYDDSDANNIRFAFIHCFKKEIYK